MLDEEKRTWRSSICNLQLFILLYISCTRLLRGRPLVELRVTTNWTANVSVSRSVFESCSQLSWSEMISYLAGKNTEKVSWNRQQPHSRLFVLIIHRRIAMYTTSQYSRVNSTKSPVSGVSNSSRLTLMSQVEGLREFVYVQVSWFLLSEQWRLQYSSAYLLQQSCDWSRRAVRFVRLAPKVVKQNDGDFVDVILLCISL